VAAVPAVAMTTFVVTTAAAVAAVAAAVVLTAATYAAAYILLRDASRGNRSARTRFSSAGRGAPEK